MLQGFVSIAMSALMSVLTPERIRGFILAGRDAVVQKVKQTEAEWDDKLLIPACDLVLAGLDIPGPDGEVDVSAEMLKLYRALGEYKDDFIDAGLDFIEQKVVDSANKVDDAIVLPMCRVVRRVLNVPDDDMIG